MKSDEELWQICLDIYNELYENATPSADFNELKKTKFHKEKGDDPEPYRDYFLETEKQQQIMEKHVEKHDLTDAEESKIATEINLGASPVSVKSAWRGGEQ